MPFDYDILLSQLIDQFGPDAMEGLSRGLLKQTPARPFVSGLEFLEQGQPRPELLGETPGRGEAQEAIAAREKLDEVRKARLAAEEAETAAMQQDAYDARLEPRSWLEPSLTEGQTAAGKLQAIRAQARAKGRSGSLGAGVDPTLEDYNRAGYREPNEPYGGTVSQADNTPELQARLKERDEWLAGQPERDLQYAMSPEQKRRDPEYAADAAGKLAQLRAVKAEEQKLANQQLLIEKVAESAGGKVPFRLAGELALGGLPVPYELRGSNPDQIKVQLEDIQAKAMQDIQGSMMAGTPEFAVRYLHYVESAMAELTKRLDAGADPDQILDEARRIVMGGAIESGTMQFLEQSQQGQ